MTGVLLALFALWGVHLLAVMSPGPSFVVTTREALVSRARGVRVAFGLALGTLPWAVGAWAGLAALFEAVPALYGAVKVAAAAFLLLIAVRTWRSARDPLPEASAPTPIGGEGGWDAVRLGVLVQIANPKVAIFFGSIFVALLPPEPSVSLMLGVFAIVCLNEFGWYALVSLLVSRSGVRVRYARIKPWADRIAGTLLGALGIGMLARG